MQTKLNFGGSASAAQKINLSFEKPAPAKKRVQKMEAKTSSAMPEKKIGGDNQKQQSSEIRGGPWGIDE